jgi:phage gp46-like protein
MLDIGLDYDAVHQRFDVVYQAPSLVLDTTARTPLLLALGTDRRAQPGDVLPDVSADPLAPKSLLERGGTALDALDATGALYGSRLWLLRNAKSTGDLGEQTRKRAESYAAEALDTVAARVGPTQLTVRWIARNALSITVAQGPLVLMQLRQPTGGQIGSAAAPAASVVSP